MIDEQTHFFNDHLGRVSHDEAAWRVVSRVDSDGHVVSEEWIRIERRPSMEEEAYLIWRAFFEAIAKPLAAVTIGILLSTVGALVIALSEWWQVGAAVAASGLIVAVWTVLDLFRV